MPDATPSVGWGTIIALLMVIVASVWLGTMAQRAVKQSSFMKSYFLGNRALGSWALALTATVQSGGTFMGFPSLVYSYGWVVALWIAGYMVVPLTGFGFVGRRFAQLSRRTGAITVPDLLRERFGSPAVGLTASLLIIFFMTFMMVAQFKAGALIMKMSWPGSGAMALSEDAAVAADQQTYYWIGLAIFALTVVGYTLIGGFLAAVWTDLFQSVLMFIGIMLLLPLAWAATGGLSGTTEQLSTKVMRRNAEPDVIQREGPRRASIETRLKQLYAQLRTHADQHDGRLPAEPPFETVPRVAPAADVAAHSAHQIDAEHEDRLTYLGDGRTLPSEGDAGQPFPLAFTPADENNWRSMLFSDGSVESGLLSEPGALVTAPGAFNFSPLGVAASFYFLWVFSGVGSPAGAVRVMACKDSATIRRSIFLLSTYNMFIYIPLIMICIMGHSLLPNLGSAHSDEVIPRMAVASTQFPGGSFVTGLILAAPFGAVMATVSTYLVVIASGLVRDVYQRFIRPDASPRQLKRVSYAVMIVIGAIGVATNIYPVDYLQALVVFSGTCGATAFAMPYFLSAYWRRTTSAGVMSSMLVGALTALSLYAVGWVQGVFNPWQPLGIDPVVWGLGFSLAAGVMVSLMTEPPEAERISLLFDAAEPMETSP